MCGRLKRRTTARLRRAQIRYGEADARMSYAVDDDWSAWETAPKCPSHTQGRKGQRDGRNFQSLLRIALALSLHDRRGVHEKQDNRVRCRWLATSSMVTKVPPCRIGLRDGQVESHFKIRDRFSRKAAESYAPLLANHVGVLQCHTPPPHAKIVSLYTVKLKPQYKVLGREKHGGDLDRWRMRSDDPPPAGR